MRSLATMARRQATARRPFPHPSNSRLPPRQYTTCWRKALERPCIELFVGLRKRLAQLCDEHALALLGNSIAQRDDSAGFQKKVPIGLRQIGV